MQSYELQVYKSGKWEFDSYFDDRRTAISEAEKLHGSGRHSGIRVLQERYREDTDTSTCTVIFSRLKRGNENPDWRSKGARETANRSAVREAINTRNSRSARAARKRSARAKPRVRVAGRRSQSGGQTSMYALFGMALLIVLVGIAAMIGLREIATFL